MSTSTPANQAVIRVWDLPTRLFHWALAISVIGAIVTVNVGGRWMDWHMPFGVAVFTLLLFRLVWGLIGSRHARLSALFYRPKEIWQYLRTPQNHQSPGHSPLGALSVLALLLVLMIQATTGLFASDAILNDGPLNQYVTNQTARLMTAIHLQNEFPMIALIGLHLLAILIYSVRGQALVRAMLTGNKEASKLAPGVAPAHDDLRLRLKALVLACAMGGLTWWLIDLGQSAGFSF